MERIPEPELMTDIDQARDYANSDFSEPHNAFVSKFKDYFPDFDTGLVADLGCGSADITIRLAKALPRACFVGFDGSEAMLGFGREAVEKAGLKDRISLEKRCLPEHGWPIMSFDAVVSNSLLHQLHHPKGLWRTVDELSKAGAPVFIMDLTRPASRGMARDLVDEHAKGAPKLMRRDFYHSLLAAFRPEEVIGQLQASNLSRLRVEVVSDRHMVIYGRG